MNGGLCRYNEHYNDVVHILYRNVNSIYLPPIIEIAIQTEPYRQF